MINEKLKKIMPPIIIDTREQNPFVFSEYTETKPIRKKLDTGDYSVEGYENCFAIERKELGDFLNCVTRERLRFERELLRATENLRRFWIIIEGSFADISYGRYRSLVKSESVLGTIAAWENRFNVIIKTCDNRPCANRMAYKILSKCYNDALEGITDDDKKKETTNADTAES